MHIFATPEPIEAIVDLSVGSLTVRASDRSDTRVEVRPSKPGLPGSVRLAEQTTVEFTAGVLRIVAPKTRSLLSWFGAFDSVHVTLELPTGSRLVGDSGFGACVVDGILGECEYRSGAGGITIDTVGSARLRTGSGSISVARVALELTASSGAGSIRLGEARGPATLKSSSGRIEVGTAFDALTLTTGSGRIQIGAALSDVRAKTASGRITVDELVRGDVSLRSAAGRIEFGIREGSAAWLDVHSNAGKIRNTLRSEGAPVPGQDVVRLAARTGAGDIVVRRPERAMSATQ
ncbi:DUF4097 family beta strand repeat-containing protein [Leucobacter luti]|uniref:Putative adhesin n=1 Tax=Leucobacter luti TaxID=340320 RepID=A0A4V6PVL8_9MICO|nr:DUF4097 family beta strand repeat-containing protein [Leucobacter luti]QYM75943.1 DUF4097 domain-containing protein [Leucobacter luti]TDP90338.1 putative adhesin [Leucobacter luti]